MMGSKIVRLTRSHTNEPREALGHALGFIPNSLLEWVDVEWMVGVNPQFSGYGDYEQWERPFGIDWKDVAHTTYPFIFGDKVTRIFLPRNKGYCWDGRYGLATVIHEFAHAFHYQTGFEDFGVRPVSNYAETNAREAFAEAFAHWCLDGPGALEETDNKRVLAFFERWT